MKFQQPLTKAFSEQAIIRIYTEDPDSDSYDGLIVCLTNEFIVLAQELDYEFEGFVLIPREHINSYRQSPVEAFTQKLLTANNDINKLTSPDWLINSTSFDDVFAGIISTFPWLCAAWVCPSCDNIHTDVGALQSFDNESLSVELFEKTGQSGGEMGWSMNKIYSLEFGSPYLKKFGQFIEMCQSTIQ